MLPSWLVYPAALLIAWGTYGYIRDIRRGVVVEPNLVTWFLWSLAPLITLAAQLRAGVGSEVVLTATVGFCPLVIFLAGLHWGTFRPRPFDWWCGAMSLVALVLWQLTGSGALAVGLSILADGFGAAPILRKSFVNPASESAGFFALFAAHAFVTLLTITEWTVVHAAFSVYIFVLYLILFALVRFRIGLRLRKVARPADA